jgi:hypothetical protein
MFNFQKLVSSRVPITSSELVILGSHLTIARFQIVIIPLG